MVDALFLFNGLTKSQKERCRQIADSEPKEFSKGAVIYDSTHAQRALAVVLDGRVRVLNGRVVMNDLSVGDVFGVAALFGGDDPYPTTVKAHTACRILFIPQQTVSAWIQAVPQVGENYIRFLSERIRFLNRRLTTLTAEHTDDKLWRYLLAHRDEDGIVHLTGGMSALAKTLDMGRSSLYRCLETLSTEGKIQRLEKNIRVILKEE